MALSHWAIWAGLLLAQNFSFTFVSRARNSGSLSRHVVAAMASNGVWFFSQIFAVGAFIQILQGNQGWKLAAGAGLFYTVFTVIGSIAAHYVALRTEKGKSSVGASSKYAQVTVDEWVTVQRLLLHVFNEQSYLMNGRRGVRTLRCLEDFEPGLIH